jgi:MtfA peptidase
MLKQLRRWWPMVSGVRSDSKPPTINAVLFERVAAKYPLLHQFNDDEVTRLCGLAERFIQAKHFEGVGGLIVTDELRAEIALQACVLVLEIGLDWYAGWQEIIVYPAQFVPRREVEDEFGIVHMIEEPMSGEAWLGGPVVLSYEDVEAAGDVTCFNVVIHEFAHKLDMCNGDANGHPPLHENMSVRAWSGAFASAFADFVARVEASPDPETDPGLMIDPYASEHPAEFFAVISEAFFDIPEIVAHEYPAVYEQLHQFYRQDPRSRLAH